MVLDVEDLLRPISDKEPLGQPLRHSDGYSILQTLTSRQEKTDWRGVFDSAMSLSRSGHDLRVWIWLARAALVTEGIPGLAAGLTLLAGGLETYWPILPPVNSDKKDPAGRFTGRIASLATLGVTSFQANLQQVTGSGTAIAVLREDLDAALAREARTNILPGAIAEARMAMARIEAVFAKGFRSLDERADPQIGFEVIEDRFAAWESKSARTDIVQSQVAQGVALGSVPIAPGGADHPAQDAAEAADGEILHADQTTTWVARTRGDIERIFDLVLDYYRQQEPCSPVPLLVVRAKRLVRLSFVEAMKDLAPSGLKELQIAAGCPNEDWT